MGVLVDLITVICLAVLVAQVRADDEDEDEVLPTRMGFYKCPKYSDAVECVWIEGVDPVANITGRLKGTPNSSEGELYSAHGDLFNESHISVSKFGNTAEVMFYLSPTETLFTLVVNLTSFNVSASPDFPKGMTFEKPFHWKQVPSEALDRVFHPKGYKMKVHVLYDRPFKDVFKDEVDARIDAVMKHAKSYFLHSTLKVKLRLEVVPGITQNYTFVDKVLDSNDAHLDEFAAYVNGNPSLPMADSYTLLSYHNNMQYGILGIAWVRTSCSSNRYYRTNMGEWYINNIKTAELVCHEIGHNLGMSHDFKGNKVNKPRYDSKGLACTGKDMKAIMGYANQATKWSGCSNDDLIKYFNIKEKFGGWCMDPIDENDVDDVNPDGDDVNPDEDDENDCTDAKPTWCSKRTKKNIDKKCKKTAIKENCAKTCGACGVVAGDPGVDTTPGEDTTPGGCIDKESKPYCAVVEKFGCDTKFFENGETVPGRKICPETCGDC